MNPLYFVIAAPFLLAIARAEATSTHIIRELEQCITNQEVDGCSIPFNSSFPYRNVFKSACNRHDVCYRCGNEFKWSRNDCDVGFLYDMYYACAVHGIKQEEKTRRSIPNEHEIDDVALEKRIEVDSEKNSKQDHATEGKGRKKDAKEKELVDKEKIEIKKIVNKKEDGEALVNHDTVSIIDRTVSGKAVNVPQGKVSKKKEEEDEEQKELEHYGEESKKVDYKEDDSSEEGQETGSDEQKIKDLNILHTKTSEAKKKMDAKSDELKTTVEDDGSHSKVIPKNEKIEHNKKHRQKGSGTNSSRNHTGMPKESTDKTGKSQQTSNNRIETISSKYHEIEKLLGELNLLIKSEMQRSTNNKINEIEQNDTSKTANMTKSKHRADKMIEIAKLDNEPKLKHENGSSEGAKNEKGNNEKGNNEKGNVEQGSDRHGNRKSDKQKGNEIDKQSEHKHHTGKSKGGHKGIFHQSKKRMDKLLENAVVSSHSEKKNHKREKSYDVVVSKNEILPEKKTYFVQCKLAAYLYFIAVRGFGQKFYRKTSPDWCKHGCVKASGKPNLRRYRRPRDLN